MLVLVLIVPVPSPVGSHFSGAAHDTFVTAAYAPDIVLVSGQVHGPPTFFTGSTSIRSSASLAKPLATSFTPAEMATIDCSLRGALNPDTPCIFLDGTVTRQLTMRGIRIINGHASVNKAPSTTHCSCP